MVEFWDKLKEWQKGVIGGSIFGIILSILFYLYQLNLAKKINDYKYVDSITGFLLPSFFTLVICSIIYGILFSLALSKFENRQNKSLIIVGYIILSLVIFYIITSQILVFIVGSY